MPQVLLLTALFMVLLVSRSVIAQETLPTRWGVQLQGYPAGLITSLRFSRALGSRDAVRVFAGYNFTDRRDFGEHDDEQGGGPGLGVAWRHYLSSGHRQWHLGVRGDLWLLEIDWEDDSPARSGSTDVTVLQPTAQAGYTLVFESGLLLEFTASLGAEINISTQGEAVGEGAILLIGIGFAIPF